MSKGKTFMVYALIAMQVWTGYLGYLAIQYNEWWTGLVVLVLLIVILIFLFVTALLIGKWED